MPRPFGEMLSAIVTLGVVAVSMIAVTTANAHLSKCPTGFANFGDSLTDTGNALNAFPFTTNELTAENPPYGENFFGAPAKRFSNGRLVPDFFSLAFGKPLLDGYFATTSFNYSSGANFAVAGATAAVAATALVPFAVVPWQINQFIRFKNSAKDTEDEGIACGNFLSDLPRGKPYSHWLFTIEAGGNDLLGALLSGTPPATIISTVLPQAVGNISIAITNFGPLTPGKYAFLQTLYEQSARKFLIFNIPPQGCSTVILTVLGNLNLTTDSLGCIVTVNELVQGFNAGLLQAVQAFRTSLPGVTISLFDYYSANIEILTNPTAYGFNPSLTTTACCGAPGLGTLNYNPAVSCGHPSQGSNNCANPDEYVIWDGIHFTENFYRTVSKFALSAQFTDQGINYTALCDLDFSKFGPEVTYKQAYPLQCNNLFG